MRSKFLAWVLSTAMLVLVGSPAFVPPAAAAGPVDNRLGIAEGFRNAGTMADIGAGFERIILPWDQIQPSGAGDFSRLGQTVTRDQLQAEINRGVQIAGLFQFTPGWAARDTQNGARSVPLNLNLPYDDPNNYFGQYVYQVVKYYGDLIPSFVIWNEPEFQPADAGAGGSFTWQGTEAEFAQLTKVGYLAAKKANPNVTVSFAATSYWDDQNAGRSQFYDRILNLFDADPQSAANNYYHDVTSLNLYRAPDDIYRVYNVFKDIQKKHGLDKPLWLTETNAMPSDDTQIPCAAQQRQNAFVQTTMAQQAAYAEQAFALGAAAGYGKVEFYQMIDADPCHEPAVWGVTRDDGTRRPVADALKTAVTYFSGYTRAQFVPLTHLAPTVCPCWPEDPTAYVTNNQVYQVAFDRPGSERVSALWNGDGDQLRVRVKKNGSSASVVDRNGTVTQLTDNQGWWVLDLPAATAFFHVNDVITDPPGYHFIGGDPLLLVEEGVDPSTPVVPPSLGDPGSLGRDFLLSLNPENGQTVGRGQAADFFLTTRGQEGFADPINISISQWSTQRFPNPQSPGSLPLQVSFPGSVTPGDVVPIHIETAGADGGIYYIDMQATSGDIGHAFELSLVIN